MVLQVVVTQVPPVPVVQLAIGTSVVVEVEQVLVTQVLVSVLVPGAQDETPVGPVLLVEQTVVIQVAPSVLGLHAATAAEVAMEVEHAVVVTQVVELVLTLQLEAAAEVAVIVEQ